MSNPIIPEIVCPRCKTAIDAADNYCRRCGTPTTAGLASSAAWWESPWVVLPMLFVVFGPLALPLLWRSRRFTRLWKLILSIVVLGGTVWLIWYVWNLTNQALAPLLQQFEGLQLDKLH
jgi:hypothetical protein